MSYDPQQYLEDHQATWGRFMKWTGFSTAAVVIVLLLMALVLL